MIEEISLWEKKIRASGVRRFIPLMTHAGIEHLNLKISEVVMDGKIQFEALKVLDKIFSPDAVCTMMDLTVEAEAFGCEVNFYDHEVPTVSKNLVNNEEEIDALKIPGLYENRTREYLKTVEYSSAYFTDKPVFAGCIGPISLAGRLFGINGIMTSMLFEPDVIIKLVEKCTVFLKSYVAEYKKSGANGIIMAEPVAGLLSAELCDQFSSDFIRSIVKEVQDPGFLFILHNCGNTGHVTQSMISTGARGLHFGNKINLLNVLEEVPQDILVMGNLDPVEVFKMSESGKLSEICTSLLDSTSKYTNFILSSGCEIPPGVSDSNYHASFEAVRKFNAAKHSRKPQK